VTKPLTFGPVYYAAWRLESTILGDPAEAPSVPIAADAEGTADVSCWEETTRRILGVGKPLLLGLTILAIAVGIATYFLVSTAWKLSVLWKRHRRRR